MRYRVVRSSGDARGRAAVVGAGIAEILVVALGLEAAGLEVDVFDRSPARLDVLRERDVFPSTALYRLATAQQRYGTVVVATTELTHEALQSTSDAVVDGGTIMLYGNDSSIAVGGLGCDSIRRGERRVAVEHADRTVHLVGTHGAITADFDRATQLYDEKRDNALRMRLARLLGPELTLHEALVELPRHVHSGFVGKASPAADESSAS